VGGGGVGGGGGGGGGVGGGGGGGAAVGATGGRTEPRAVKPRQRKFLSTKFVLHFILFSSRDNNSKASKQLAFLS
jgi:hypothetical protein